MALSLSEEDRNETKKDIKHKLDLEYIHCIHSNSEFSSAEDFIEHVLGNHLHFQTAILFVF